MNQLKEYRNPRVCMAQQRAVLAAIGMTLFACLGCPAGAQDASSYPNKPVRIFVPYGAGGVGDLTMRLLAQKLSETSPAPADRCRRGAPSLQLPTATRLR